MSEQQHIFEKIEDFLQQRMTEEERAAFENQIAQDEVLASMVHEAKVTDEAIHMASLAALKEQVALDIKNIKYNSGPDWAKMKYLIIAATMVVISVIVVYMVSQNRKNAVEETAVAVGNKNTPSDNIRKEQVYDSLPVEEESEKEHTPGLANTTLKKREEATSDQTELVLDSAIVKDNMPLNAEEVKPDKPENKISQTHKDTNRTKLVSPGLSEVKIECNKDFKIKSEPACQDTETGSITVLSDGLKEYHYQVGSLTASGPRGDFHNLPAGEHTIVVSYNQECTYTKVISIREKWCPMNKSYSFNPDYNEKWEIKYPAGSAGIFTIFDKLGKEVYKGRFGSGNEGWAGIDVTGQVVPLGTYIAILEYSDGRKEKVDLTIVR